MAQKPKQVNQTTVTPTQVSRFDLTVMLAFVGMFVAFWVPVGYLDIMTPKATTATVVVKTKSEPPGTKKKPEKPKQS